MARMMNGVKTSAASSSVEDYVKVIYSFTEWQDKPITSSQLAQRLGVANSSVSEMVRKLKDLDLVDHQPYGAVRLTEAGRTLALTVVRRHRLIETFLVRDLGYGWDEVHDEAELLEHAVSETFVERLSARLGHPQRDPHGDPIPDAEGTVIMPAAHLLAELDPGHQGRITRISDDDPDLLRYLSSQGVDVDSVVTVGERKPFGGALQLEVRDHDGGKVTLVELGEQALTAVWVVDSLGHEGCTLD